MTSSVRHIIGKQTLEITARSIPVVQKWEQKSVGIVRDVISPCIESCFDQLAGSADHFIIDRWEIELGEVSESNFRELMPERLKKAIFETLRDIAPQDISFNDCSATATERPNRPVRLSQRNAVLDAFVYFLKFGLLPWWCDPSDASWSAEWISHLRAEELDKIIEVVKAPVARQRIVYQFDDEFLSLLVARSTNFSTHDILDIWAVLINEGINSNRRRSSRLRLDYWQLWINIAVQNVRGPEIIRVLTDFILLDKIMRKALIHYLSSEPITPSIPADGSSFTTRVLHAVQKRLSQVKDTRDQFDNSLTQQKQVSTSAAKNPFAGDHPPYTLQDKLHDKSTANISSLHVGLDKGEKDIHLKSAEDSAHSKAAEAKQSAEILSEGIHVQDAGIVLLHPFLPELFRECGLWLDGHWTQHTSVHIAVRLLAWLANGNAEVPEYLIPLHKTLCGVPIEAPIVTGLETMHTHIESCTDLLNAVVTHWTAIGKTSPDGLREGFIQRQGKLESKDDGWLLTVEKKAQDVLLSKVPWGISFIRFPWLDRQQIYVDWT